MTEKPKYPPGILGRWVDMGKPSPKREPETFDGPGGKWEEHYVGDVAHFRPLFDPKVKGWAAIAEDFGYTTELVAEEKMSPYEKKIRNGLATGKQNALIYGPPGTGKTTVALIALKELHNAGRFVKAIRFSSFKTKMEPRYCDANDTSPDAVLDTMVAPDFLLVDELGYGEQRSATTEHERRILFDLISLRHGRERKTWLLSNIGRDQLYKLYSRATMERIDTVGECLVADFKGRTNYRMEAK